MQTDKSKSKYGKACTSKCAKECHLEIIYQGLILEVELGKHPLHDALTLDSG